MIDIVKSISSIIDLAKKVRQSIDAVKVSEANLVIADLITQLADLKIRCSDLVTENHDLREKLIKAKQQEAVSLNLCGDVYMDGTDGPFCTTCWDQNEKKIRLKEEIEDFQEITGHKYICPVCQSHHKGDST